VSVVPASRILRRRGRCTAECDLLNGCDWAVTLRIPVPGILSEVEIFHQLASHECGISNNIAFEGGKMIRLPNVCRFPLSLGALVPIALFVTSQCASLLSQSSQSATAPTLEVISAHYNRINDTIKFRLVNNSQKVVTAYYVAFGVMVEKHVMWESGTGKDLLDLILTSQCRYAGPKSPEGDDSWEGAIKPGDVYVQSNSANLPKNQLTAFEPPVQAAVVGIIWSDGSVETPTVTGAKRWVTIAINRLLDQRKEDAQESLKVAAILSAYPEDADIQHRLGEAIKSLQSLMDEYRRAREAPESRQTMHHDSTFLVSRVLNNLNNFASLPRPEVPFNAYRAVFDCESKRRIAMVSEMSPTGPER
jgi:hypothetical protein